MKEAILIKNGNIITMDENSRASWIFIEDGKISSIGEGEEYEKLLANDIHIIDARGCTVLPGFVDSHFHVVRTAISDKYLSLEKAYDYETVGKCIEAASKNNPKALILANKLDCGNLKEGKFPDRTVLDKYCNTAPVVIYSNDFHVVLLNTYGILYYKVPFLLNGVEVDENGVPTGIFRNQAGAKLDTNIIKSFSDEQIHEALSEVIPSLLEYGVTTVAAMEGSSIKASFEDDYESEFVYRNHENYPISMELFYQTTEIERVIDLGLKRIGGALYLDGTLGAHTAALSFDYADEKGKRGFLCFEQEYLNNFVKTCCEKHLQVALDAIGDAAIEAALTAYEYASKKFDVKSMRHRIEHSELITPTQMKRAKNMGIILSMQPTYEGYWGSKGEMYEQRLGKHYGETNSFREITDAGVMICGGSDSSVTVPNPLLGIHYAVNHPIKTHRVTLMEALKMYTYNGAYALFRENEIGSLTPGKIADIVILDRDITEERLEKIKEIRVDVVIKEGELMIDRGSYVKD